MKWPCALLLISLLAFAQSDGTLEITVLDASGAMVPAANVTLTAPAGKRASAITPDSGLVRFPNLAPGEYKVTLAASGFATQAFTVLIESGATVRTQRFLSAASISEQVNVSAVTQLLQTTRATQTASLSSKELISLPTASRNYTHLIGGEAGVNAPLPDRTGKGMNLATAPGAQGDDATQSLNPSVNGARPTNNALTINGLDATNMMNANGSLGNNLNVPLDAVEVVEVQTALFSATTGRNGGGNIQIVTRSGTNQFHGSLYHYLQNEKLNANEFFLNRAGTGRPRLRRNESGFTFSGPIRKDKTFFFASVQRTQFTSGYAARAIANTGIANGLGDVRTRESIAQVANEWLRSGAEGNPQFAANFLTGLHAFPAEQVPGLLTKFFDDVNALHFRTLQAADIHPVAVNILNAKRSGRFLLPSVTDSMPLLTGNASFGTERLLQQSFPTEFLSWSGNGSLENNFSSKNRLRLNYIRAQQEIEEAFGWANSSPSPTYGLTPSWTASLSDIHTFSPTWVNELRGGFFELYNTRISKYRDFTNSSLGIYNPLEGAVGGLASLMPTIDINTQRSTSGIGNAWDFFDRQRTINVYDAVTHIRGKHTITFGGELRRPTIAGEYMARTNGDLDYGNWVLFFTGHGAAGGGSDLDQGDTRRHFKFLDLGAFVQDDWRVSRSFTLNLGVRYDYYGNPTEARDRIGTYYTNGMAARAGVKPGFYVPENSIILRPDFDPLQIGIAVEPGVGFNTTQVYPSDRRSVIRPDHNNFAPRVGFAWQPRDFQKLVVRGGYGIFFERMGGGFKTDLQLSAPFFIYQNVPAPVDMADPYPKLNVNPFQIPFNVTFVTNAAGTPSWRRADGTPFPSTSPFNPKNNTFVDPFIKTPYTQQWTFNLQFEPWQGNMIDMRYVGSRGVGLVAKLNLAQPEDPRVKPVNGFNNIYNSAGALISPDFFVKPEFLGLNRAGGFRLRSNWAASTYHAFQVNFRRRFQRGLTWNLAYTFSKSLDNISSDGGVVEHDGYNIANNRGRSDFDRPHRFTASYLWEIPSPFRSHRIGHHILGGWSFSGMATLQSGSPFSPLGNATRNAQFAQPARIRLDFAPGKTLADAVNTGRVQDRLTAYFNPGAFTDSLDRWGNAGRNILRGPSQIQFDFSLGKTARITERAAAEFRWEIYNASNTPVFNNPASTFAANGPGTAGVISSTMGGPRTMQAAMRVRF